MRDGCDILLLADQQTQQELSVRLEGGLLCCDDPYAGLEEMSRRRWKTVILSSGVAAEQDFAGLCRASRRLQREGRLLVVCPASTEPVVRNLAGPVIDDYFISPLNRTDISRILHPPITAADVAADEAETTDEGRPIGNLVGIIEASRSIADLEAASAEIVSRSLGKTVKWCDVDRIPVDSRPLVLAAADAPRALVAENPGDGFTDAQEEFLRHLQQYMPALVSVAKRTELLHRLAITDHLTGAYNRRYFYHLTDQVLARADDKNYPVTVLLFDIDNFKRYNDTYGHATGDDILRQIVGLLKKITRAHDIVARIGGDEFAVLFWDGEKPRQPNSKPIQEAFALSDRFRRAVTRHEFPSLGPEARGSLSISGGLATFPEGGNSCRELLRSADKALKAIKKTGKNAIRLVGKE